MKIVTKETVQRYETWEYDVDEPLPEGFTDWNGEDQYAWLQQFSGNLVESESANLGTVDSLEFYDTGA